MGFLELFEVGFFSALFYWANPVLTAFEYAFLALGFAVQFFLQKKKPERGIRWGLIAFCGLGILLCEGLWYAITGWDRLIVDVCYGMILCVLLGAAVSILVFWVRGRKKPMRETGADGNAAEETEGL